MKLLKTCLAFCLTYGIVVSNGALSQVPTPSALEAESLIQLVRDGEQFVSSRVGGFSVSYTIAIEMPPPPGVDSTERQQLRFTHVLSRQNNKWRHETGGVRTVRGDSVSQENTSVETYNGQARRMFLCSHSRTSGAASGHIWANDTIGNSLTYTSFMGGIGGQALSAFLSEHKDSIKVAAIGSDLQVTVTQQDGSQFVMTLDSRKAFQVRERRFYASDSRLQSTMVVKHMHIGDNVWVPQEAFIEQLAYRDDGSSYTATKTILEPIDNDCFKYNCTFPESHFVVQFPDGTHIADHIIGVRYALGSLGDESIDNLATIANVFSEEAFGHNALPGQSATSEPTYSPIQTMLETRSDTAESGDPNHTPWYGVLNGARGLLVTIIGAVILGLVIILIAARRHTARKTI